MALCGNGAQTEDCKRNMAMPWDARSDAAVRRALHWLMKTPFRYRGRPVNCLMFAVRKAWNCVPMLFLHKLSVWRLAGKMAVLCLMLFALRVSCKFVSTSQSAVSLTHASEAWPQSGVADILSTRTRQVGSHRNFSCRAKLALAQVFVAPSCVFCSQAGADS